MARPGDPRNGRPYRRAVKQCIADHGGMCHLCGHGGAGTADHIVSAKEWLALHGNYDGVNDPDNMAPAHGVMGRRLNRCPVCGLLCNQVRGARPLTRAPRSRDW